MAPLEPGVSAWVIEGIFSENRIVGCNMVPGSPSDQSAYHSKLAGLLGTMSPWFK
jgi:hypothetical protein